MTKVCPVTEAMVSAALSAYSATPFGMLASERMKLALNAAEAARIPDPEVEAATKKLVAYLRRQGGQCNRQQPIVPVAGSELLKAADLIDEALNPSPAFGRGK
jgi:hypothetical protein